MKNLVADRTDIQGHRTGAFGGESVSGKGHPALRDDLPHQRGREEPGPPSTARTASAPPVGPPSAELAESGDRAVAFSPLVERPWFRCPSSPDRRNDVARHRVVACALAQAVALIIVAASMPVAASPAVAATGDATGGVVRHIEWGPCPVELPTRRDVDCGSLLVPEVRGDPGSRTVEMAFAVVRALEPSRPAPIVGSQEVRGLTPLGSSQQRRPFRAILDGCSG
jgi:hypothetical protein